jgi:hypothetical protein
MNTRVLSIVKVVLRSTRSFQLLLLMNVKLYAGISMLTSSHYLILRHQNSATALLEHALLIHKMLLLIRNFTGSSNYATGLLH